MEIWTIRHIRVEKMRGGESWTRGILSYQCKQYSLLSEKDVEIYYEIPVKAQQWLQQTLS